MNCDTTILVNTCDDYHDVLPIFFCAIQEFWKGHNFPINLNSEYNCYVHSGIDIFSHTVDKNEKLNWGYRFKKTLSKLNHKFVINLADDYILESIVEKKRIVVDESIPKWVQEQLSKVENTAGDEIQAYFGSNDSSFGSSFSTLDNKEEKPFISSFTYIGEEQKINTPEEESNNSSSNSRDSYQNNGISNDYERLQNERQGEFQNIQRR